MPPRTSPAAPQPHSCDRREEGEGETAPQLTSGPPARIVANGDAKSLAYRTLGFKNFQTYLGDRLEVSPRWAMYLIKLVRKMHDFEIDRKDLVRLDISKCLEIFRLDDARMVRELVEQTHAAKLTLSEIRQIVHRALGIRPISSDEVVKKLWAFPLDQWLVVERAIQHVQRGGLVSDTRALELICADFLAGIQHEALEAQVC